MATNVGLVTANGGVNRLVYHAGTRNLDVYYTSGQISSFFNVPWAEVIAIAAAPTATIATSATPVAEINANVVGKYRQG